MRESSKKKREAILKAATKLFLKEGYEATSINQIVSKVGGSKSTVYSFFKNKEDLFRAIVDQEMKKNFAPFIESETILKGENLKEELVVMSKTVLDIITNDDGNAIIRLVFAEAKKSPEIGKHLYDQAITPLSVILENYLFKVTQRKTINGISNKTITDYFFGMLIHKAFMETMLIYQNQKDETYVNDLANRTVKDFIKLFNIEKSIVR